MVNWHAQKWTIVVFLFGFVIREVFSSWTGHPFDFELWVRLGYAIDHGINPYAALPSVPGLSFANVFSVGGQNSAVIAYLPFWPFVTGLMYAIYSVVGFNDRFAYYFLLKQPVILGDVGLAYLLWSYVCVKNPNKSLWILSFWLLSPFMIIISGIWGMFDSIAVSFIMISLRSEAYLKRAFWAGLAIFVKSVPIIYSVPVTFRQSRNLSHSLIPIGLATLFSVAAFLILKWPVPTIQSALLSAAGKGGESMSIWDTIFYLNYLGLLPGDSYVYRVLGWVWIPAIALSTLIALRRFKLETDNGLVQSLLLVTLTFLIFRARVTEQYAIYLFAFMAIDVAVWNPKRKSLLLLSLAVALAYLISNQFLLIDFLSPVYPNFAQIESGLYGGLIRLTANLLLGSIFTYLNVRYLITILKPRL